MTGFYELANLAFAELLQSTKDNYSLWINFGYSSLQLKRFEEVLSATTEAIKLNSNKPEGLMLRGIALFHLGKNDDANKEIEKAKLLVSSLDPKASKRVEVESWDRKIKAKIDNKILVKPAPKPVENKKRDETSIPSQYHPTPGKISYEWQQTNEQVHIAFKWGLKNKESLKVNFKNDSFDISFPIADNKNFEMNFQLFDDIDPSQSYYVVQIERIEVKLVKKNQDDWALLERSDAPNEKVLESIAPKPVSKPKANAPQAAYPSSSKVKKDWAKIDKEIEEDMQKNKEEYPEGDPVNGMFQMLYKNSDENTRRAMMKSYQTSGGTVLSMNWDEVKQKDYEGKDRVDAPDGQEWKKWDK